MKKLKLDLNESDEDEKDDNRGLKINTAYARSYDRWRHLEETQKLKDKYGDVASDDGDSESSEEPTTWSAEQERRFLTTLAALKSGNPVIYTEEDSAPARSPDSSMPSTSKTKKKKVKPMFPKDYERKFVLDRGGRMSEDEDDQVEQAATSGYSKQQEQLRAEIRAAVAISDESEELLVKRVKSDREKKEEEDEYYKWLKEEEEATADLRPLKEAWTNPDIDSEERFLRDYLVHKQYDTEGDVDGNAMPTYEEIVNVDEDDAQLERERQFEHKYNFRFEEPDEEFIKQYPRTVKESLRRANEKRKEIRDSYKERKKAEKRARMDEMKELKALKKKEIEEKLARLRRTAGNDALPLNVADLDADFDPADHDRRMQALFNDDYYKEEEGAGEEEEKPQFSNDEEDDSDYDNWETSRTVERDSEAGTSRSSSRKKKGESKFAEVASRPKPVYDPKEKSFEQYVNEYYAMNYEDVIGGDTFTRFKYRSVPANDFGLSTHEILHADDRQLNAWASLKKVTAYRTDKEENYDIQAYRKKANNTEMKRRVLNTDFGGKRSKKMAMETSKGMEKTVKKARGKGAVSDERIRAYGVNPKKMKRRKKKK